MSTETFMQRLRSHPDSKVMADEDSLHTMLYGVIVELKRMTETQVSLEKILSNLRPSEGRASLALAVICDLADMCGVTITGKIRKFDDGLSNEQLRRWYSRNNFDVRGDSITRTAYERSI